jgi:hypothetical protein
MARTRTVEEALDAIHGVDGVEDVEHVRLRRK